MQNGAGDALAATDVAGDPGFQHSNWNNLGRWGVTVPVVSSIGAASGITASWDSNNTWNTGSGTSTPDHKLMHGYLDATGQANWETVPYQFFWNENKPQVYLTGISAWLAGQGATLYDVVVYIDGDTTGRIRRILAAGDWQRGGSTGHAGQRLDLPCVCPGRRHLLRRVHAGAIVGQLGRHRRHGNFVVFPGLSADRFILRTEERDIRAPISAIQLMPVMAELHDGDTDGDGDVDLDDFAAIRDHFRMSVASRALGDLNEDGFVDFLDFREWREQLPVLSGQRCERVGTRAIVIIVRNDRRASGVQMLAQQP